MLECGSVPTQAFLETLGNDEGCEDNLSFIPPNDVTFNLVIGYSTFDTETVSKLSTLEQSLQAFYNQHHIYFNITYFPLPIADFTKNPFIYNVKDKCISMWVSSDLDGRPNADIGEGRIWSGHYVVDYLHEMGHALGLLHTFQPTADDGINPIWLTDELNERNLTTGECRCNCLKEGDRICDTPADPYPNECSSDECWTNWWDLINDPPTNSYHENHGKTDRCNNEFNDDSQYNNIMNYHGDPNQITQGQLSRIFKQSSNPAGGYFYTQPTTNCIPTVLTNHNINSPTLWNTNRILFGDLNIYEPLIIEDSKVEFISDNSKIRIHPGGRLIIRNSIIRDYMDEGLYCLPISYDNKSGNLIGGIEFVGGSEFSLLVIEENSKVYTDVIKNTGPTNGTILIKSSEIFSGVNSIYLDNFQQGITSINNSKLNGDIKVNNSTRIIISDNNEINQFSSGSLTKPVIEIDNCDLIIKGGLTINAKDGLVLFNGKSYKNLDIDNFTFISNNGFGNTGSIKKKGIEVNNANLVNISNGLLENEKIIINTANVLRIHDVTINGPAPNGPFIPDHNLEIISVRDYDLYSNEINGIFYLNGLVIAGIGNENSNMIVGNILNNCKLNNNALTDNGGPNSGLTITCNNFVNSTANDLEVFNDINPNQGSSTNPAGNAFTYLNQTNDDILYNGNQPIMYWFKNIGTQKPLQHNLGDLAIESFEDPTCLLPIPDDPNPDDTSWDAPTHQEPTPPWNEPEDEVVPPCTWYWPPVLPEVIRDIITSIEPEYPNVPTRIIYEFFENSELFSEEEMTELLVGNPAVILDDYIGCVVFESGSFSPTSILEILEAYLTGDERTEANARWSEYLKIKTAMARHNLVYHLRNDSYSESLYRQLMGFKKGKTLFYGNAESYYREGDYTSWQNLVNNRNTNSIRNLNEQDEFNKYKDIMNILLGYLQNGYPLQTMSEVHKTTLRSIAVNNFGIATVKARSILTSEFDETFEETPPLDICDGITFREEKRLSNTKEFSEKELSVYPNPAFNKINVVIPKIKDENEYRFELYNSTGVLVLKQNISNRNTAIDINTISAGTYMYKIYQGDILNVTENLIIIR